MKIAWFTENYPPHQGGMARSCYRIVYGLRKHFTVDIIHFSNKHQTFVEENELGGTYLGVPLDADASHTLNRLWAYLETHIPLDTYDWMVSFGGYWCLKSVPLFAQWTTTPLLLCIRGNDFDHNIFSSRKIDLLYAIDSAKAIACVTQEKQNRIARMTTASKVYFTANAIDLEFWNPLEVDYTLAETYKDSLPRNKHIIGLIGFIKIKKGVGFFVQSLEKSSIRNSYHLHIVGELSPEIVEYLLRKDISYSVVKPESHSSLMAHYIACDAIAIPSIYDGMPNVMLEAAALQKPILGALVGGLADVLDADNAYVFRALDEISLIAAIKNYHINTTEDRNKRAKALYQKIKLELSLEKEIDTYIKILNSSDV
ncbi:MAG: glycosyltransferase family 4 protein [Flavobacteriaceae bacterium]|nr:glycosyltransferase family 4 protein [Flavobacteriaceae bacterium]